MNYFENIKTAISNKMPNFVGSLFIFIIFYVVATIIRNNISNENNFNDEKTNLFISDESNYSSKNLIQHQIGSFVFYIILTVGSIFAVINLGFNVTTIITILASMGLAIGIAMQGALGNIISGIIISINDIFNINDIIKINNILNDNTIYGKVIDFNLYFTTIYDPLKKSIVTVPNSTIQNNLLTNVSRSKLLIKK
jgi:small conductance mechanosensitive channel